MTLILGIPASYPAVLPALPGFHLPQNLTAGSVPTKKFNPTKSQTGCVALYAGTYCRAEAWWRGMPIFLETGGAQFEEMPTSSEIQKNLHNVTEKLIELL